ncbi:MAG: aldehyde dehydrogenase family protein [Elusimicrobiota bacterium]
MESPAPRPPDSIPSRADVPASPDEARDAVSRARRAFAAWRETSFSRRAACLNGLRRALARDADAWARAVTEEIGKPLLESYGAEVLATLEALKVLAEKGESWLRDRTERRTVLDWARGVRRLRVRREPWGVVGILGAWNYPLLINLRQIAAALFCGNAVVWKPSELADGVGRRMGALFETAGFPPDAVVTLSGGGETGERLVRAGCDKIVFTGRVPTGRRILAALAEQGVPSVMELSGMDAALVFPDAPIAFAARALAWGAMTNGGQACVAARRIIVHQDAASRFVPALAKRVKALRLGNPLDPQTEIGPVRSPEILRRLEDAVRRAKENGGRVLCGGRAREEAGKSHFEPTLISGLANCPEEDTFGPLAFVQEARDEDHMETLANAGPYGLGASLWSRDAARAETFAERLHAGVVWINDVMFSAGDMRLPFGGVKASGYGRLHGPEGLREMTRTKSVETCRPGGYRPYYFPYGGEKLDNVKRFIAWRHG